MSPKGSIILGQLCQNRKEKSNVEKKPSWTFSKGISNNLQNSEEFYDICKERMASWKEKYSISDPKVGDLI